MQTKNAIRLFRQYRVLSFWMMAILASGFSAKAFALTQAELNLHRAQWNAQSISDYDYTLTQLCFCGPIISPARVSVRSDVVIRVADPITMAVVAPPFLEAYRTVDGMFEFLQQGLIFPAHTLSANFDPQLGYPRRFDFDFAAGAIDDEGFFAVADFVVIPEPATWVLVLGAAASLLSRRRF